MAAGQAPVSEGSIRKVALASFIGTAIEWYDYFLYGTAAALVFPVLFFPESDPTTGILLSLATFGVGFASRPLGGVIFGHFGDRIGRKAMLVATLLIMGVATALIGFLPTYGPGGHPGAHSARRPEDLPGLRRRRGVGRGGADGRRALS